ncbi:protein of unknown function DUF126 [Methanosalsum zhilinae DSM 4017]|uniref:Phosphomevalonate dehydratase small subunit n=1 Tax=Methanosalsum zhilinae (strain DSM 4017 / NBRC 107636 / OCM 62 / WeN5) TaxID=679901 RepID=F7XP83_METZD|nr:DUF126 domain-containing protein [Methanosalsum zhilinae]AEH61378.1 protein of unknown function DUF126 [Methanosalsum zhilinae DSM 4017]
MIPIKIQCRSISKGTGEGTALVSRDPISFLGNVDPETGIIVDPDHELYGKCIKDTVLVFPSGKGSTVGSYVLYQLKKNGFAPAAMVNLESEPIVAVGAIISDIPLVDRPGIDIYETIKDGDFLKVNGIEGYIEITGNI